MTIYKTCCVSGLLLGLLLVTTGVAHAAGQSNSQYVIDRDIINAGGGRSQSPTYVNIGSLGQTSPLGSSSNLLHVVYAGFWHGKSFTLSVAKSGTGNGTVKDCVTAPGNCPGTRINCHDSNDDCSDFFAEGSHLNFYPFDDPDSDFAGWFVDGAPIAGPLYITRDLVVTAAFTKKPDTDADGLSDEWEEIIIDADPNDGIVALGDVNPTADFDGDGLTNSEEFWNETDPTALTEIIADIMPMDAAGTTEITEAQRLTPFRMHLQLRIRSDNRPAKLVRDVTVMADGTGRFDTSNVHIGSIIQNSVFPGRIYTRTDSDGQFAIDIMSIEGGQVAFHVENVAGGGGVALPASKAIAIVDAPVLSATETGRRLVFPSGQDSVEIRIADFAAALYNFSASASATWTIEGFSFQHVRIGKNGYVLLGQQSPLSSTTIDWQTAPNGLLVPFLDDLTVKPESRVYINWFWLTEPYFMVQWCRMGHALDPDAELTFQAQIWQRSGQVRFVYDNMANGTGNYADGRNAAIGMKYGATAIYPWTGTVGVMSALEVVDSSASMIAISDPDEDKDGLGSAEEAQYGTDPRNWDSDHDRMRDAWEVWHAPALNPLVDDANADADGDGYTNIIECYSGSDPEDPTDPAFSEPDTDLDGMPDSWENTYGLNPNSASDAMQDADNDWYCNVLEYVISGDPTDPANHGVHPNETNGGATYATYP